MKLAIDGLCFQTGDGSRQRLWSALAPRLAARAGASVVLLDRGDSPSLPGVETVPFPSFRPEFAATDSLLLDRFCRAYGIDVFLSAGYGAPVSIPALLFYDPTTEVVVPDWREEDLERERKLALHFAGFRLCPTRFARESLVHDFPALDNAATLLAPNESDEAAPTWEQTAAFILELAEKARAEAREPPMRRFFAEWRRLRALQAEIMVSP